jgi:glycosyltransferase involved in cell wall biosynthesis
MNILLINHYAGSKSHGMEFRPFYMAREWVRAGHNVKIIAASYSHIRAKRPVVKTNPLDEKIEGIQYRWYLTPTYHGNGLGRVKNMLSFIFQIWKDTNRIAVEFKPNVVIASSTYPMDIWSAKRIANLSKAKLIFEVHDLWPLSPIELGGMSKWHPFIMCVQIAEDYAYKHADKVVCMLPKALPYMQSRGMNPNKFAYIPNGIDDSEWLNPIPLDTDFRQKINALRNQQLPIIGYAGTHGLANALDTLLDAAKLLVGKANIVMVGTGPARAKLLERVSQENISNVLMLPAIDKKMIPSFLASIDIAYIGWHLNPLYRFGISPNKLMDYMMASKPIIHAVVAGNDPVADAKCGFTVPPNQPDAISDAVIKISSLSLADRLEMGNRGRTYILKNQTYKVLAHRFLQAITTDSKLAEI